MNLPEAFLARMKKQLGAEYDAFVASYDADTSYGLRLNLLKGTVDEIIPVLPFALTNVPWIPEGFHVSSTERPGKHILHEAGAYYIQDPSAMSVITHKGKPRYTENSNSEFMEVLHYGIQTLWR